MLLPLVQQRETRYWLPPVPPQAVQYIVYSFVNAWDPDHEAALMHHHAVDLDPAHSLVTTIRIRLEVLVSLVYNHVVLTTSLE